LIHLTSIALIGEMKCQK